MAIRMFLQESVNRCSQALPEDDGEGVGESMEDPIAGVDQYWIN